MKPSANSATEVMMASWAVLAEKGVMHTLIERMKVEMKSNTQGENFSMIIPPANLTDFVENHSSRSFSCGLPRTFPKGKVMAARMKTTWKDCESPLTCF